MKSYFSWILSVIWIVLATACSGNVDQSGIIVEKPWIRATGLRDNGGEHLGMGTAQPAVENSFNSAAYMIIRNSTGQDDRLVLVKCRAATAVELHQTEMNGDVMMMQPVESLLLPDGEQVVFEPGGLHIMLIGLKTQLLAGQNIEMVLLFENAGEVSIQAEVRAP